MNLKVIFMFEVFNNDDHDDGKNDGYDDHDDGKNDDHDGYDDVMMIIFINENRNERYIKFNLTIKYLIITCSQTMTTNDKFIMKKGLRLKKKK